MLLTKEPNKTFVLRLASTLIPGNSDAISTEIKKYSTQFRYRSLLNAPSDRDVDAADANVITYKQPINMIKSWNKMTANIIAKNANEVWGGALATGQFLLPRTSTNCLYRR